MVDYNPQGIVFHDLGKDGPIVHLAHANGFPPGTYRPLAERLSDRYRVIAVPSLPLKPGAQPQDAPTWHPLAEDLIQELDRQGLAGIVGFGHSLGGVLTLWAAIARPDLFRCVVLVDPVILPPTWLWMLRLMRALGLRERQPFVQGALRRRRVWPDRGACLDHYRGKAIFATWPEASLRSYVESGTRQRPDGQVELAYPPEWEAHIFATTPCDIWRDVPRLRVPALIIRGQHSQTFHPAAQARMARMLPQACVAVIADAGHLLPMERPAETAAAVHGFVAGID